MNIIEKIFDLRDDELVSISATEKKELLKLCPNYYESPKIEKLICGNIDLENAFEEFCTDIEVAHSYFNKKYYLAGLKDGIEIIEFGKSN